MLLSVIWGLKGGHTTLCVQGISGSGKTYCASMLLMSLLPFRRCMSPLSWKSRRLFLTLPPSLSGSTLRAPNSFFWPRTMTPSKILEDIMGTPADDFPPTLHEYYICTLYQNQYLLTGWIRGPKPGGTASLFFSIKISDFLTTTKEAQSRNLVALTRSKGLSVVLLPTNDGDTHSLHFFRTMCAYRHGLFHIGALDIDLNALAAFLVQPDTRFLRKVGYLHTRSPGMVRGIFCPLPFLLPTSNIHIFSLFLSGKRCCLAIPTLWTPPVLNGGALSQGTMSPLYVLATATSTLRMAKLLGSVSLPGTAGAAACLLQWSARVGSPSSGGHPFFFQDATFNRGHAHLEGSRLVDPDEEFLPPSLLPGRPPRQRLLISPWLPCRKGTLLPLGYLRPVKRSSEKAWRPSHLQSFFKLRGLTTATFCLHTALLLWQVFNGTIFSWYAIPVLLLPLAPRWSHLFSWVTPLRSRLILTMSSPVVTQRGPTFFKSNGLGPRSLPRTMILSSRGTIKTFTANSLVTSMIWTTGCPFCSVGRPWHAKITTRVGYFVHAP